MAASDAIQDPQSPEVPVWPGHGRVPIRKRSTHGRTEAMATITLERLGAWTDPGPLRCPRCNGALRRTDAGFDCDAEECGASLPIRDGVLVVNDALADDNKIAADFYNSKLWPKVRFWERIFWVLNGGERRARDMVLDTCRSPPAFVCSTSPSATASTQAGFQRTGRSSASTSPQASSPPASALTPAAISGSF